MTKQEFINRVLLIMNEASMADPSGSVFIGADSAKIEKLIEGSFVEAWRRCVKVMPRTWFANKSFSDAPLSTDLSNGTGFVELPNDYYLLTSFKMRGWKKNVQDAIIANEQIMAMQANMYVRGTQTRPICVIDMQDVNGEIKTVLRYYSLKEGLESHTVEQAIYVPIVEPLTGVGLYTDLNLNKQVMEPLTYIAASTVFTMLEKKEAAKALNAIAVEMFPGLESVKNGVPTIKQ